jgi:hypothetical protein
VSVSVPANASVSNPLQAALKAIQTGQDPEAAVYGKPAEGDTPAPEGEADEAADSFSGLADGSHPEAQSTDASPSDESSEEQSEEQPSAEAEKAEADVEELIVTDEDGRKFKLKVDWNDREKLKRQIQERHAAVKGMRKFQAERDQATSRLKEIEPRLKDFQESWESVEQAFKQAGVRGVVNLLGGEKAWDSAVDREMILRNGTPAQKERLVEEERLAKLEADKKRLEKQVQDHLTKAEQEREEAFQRDLSARINPAFEKYRFAGKLGDPVAEHQYDQAVWDQTMSRLDEWADAHRKANGLSETAKIEVPREVIEREFRTVSATFQKFINKQAEQKAATVIKKKKEAAAESAAVAATKGMRQSSEAEAFKNNIRQGNLLGAFKQFASGKVKI